VNVLTALQVQKSIYDYVVYESEVEREFARRLDQRNDIRLFVKLPDWFKVETPVGTYNPDWAIVKHDEEIVYLVRETKGTKDFLKLRTTEADKVRADNITLRPLECHLPSQRRQMMCRVGA
jgi:type III restriction enzyme